MKRIMPILGILLLLLVGCSYADSKLSSKISKQIALSDIPESNQVIASPWITYATTPIVNNGSLPMYPPKIVLGNVRAGSIIDTLTRSEINKDEPDYYLKEGDPVTVNIHNPSSSNITVSLIYEDIDSPTNDIDTGLIYSPAPKIVKTWVIISTDKIEIPSNSIVHVPIALLIPRDIKNINLPSRWEFRVRVSNIGQVGMFQTDTLQRWLVSMN